MPLAPTKPAPKRNAKKLAPAIVMTVALLVVPQGCGGQVDDGTGPGSSDAGAGGSTSKGGSGGTGGSTSKGGSAGSTTAGSGGSTSPSCPATQPTSGACTGDQTCTYPTGSGCPPQTSRCEKGKWVASFSSCNPPPPPCPAGEIVEGETCPGGGFGVTTCPRVVDGCNVTFQCQGTWKKTADSCGSCPIAPPVFDTQCPSQGVSCDYEIAGCPLNLTCQNGRWLSTSPPCDSPEPVVCPAAAPKAGTACGETKEEVKCAYTVSGSCVESFVCFLNIWSRTSKPCDEPAKPACEAALDSQSCTKAPGCRWLVPGCASPPQVALAKAGCFASTECAADAECGAGRACKSVVTDPCVGKSCDACGQEQKVCQ